MSTPDTSSVFPSPRNKIWTVVLGAFFAAAIPTWLMLCLMTSMNVGPNAFSVAMFGLTTYFCAMLGFWTGLGTVWWRWIVIAIASPMMGVISGYNSGGEPEFHVYCLSIIGIIALTTLILRVWKGSLHVVTVLEESVDALQFGIKDIFIWTTAIAVFLGVGRFALKHFDFFGQASQGANFLLVFGLALSISIAIVINIWAMLGNRITVVKTMTLILITVGAMVTSAYMIRFDYFFGIVTLVSQMLILFTMFVLRRQGFRFVKANSGVTGD